MRTYYWTLLLLVGCGFDGGRGTPPDSGMVDAGADAEPDSTPIEQIGIDFLPETEENLGNTNWTITADTEIDTSTLTITPAPPAGVTFKEGTQHDGTSKVAILRVRDLKIDPTKKLTAKGGRPLFILADHDVTIEGLLDVGAHGNVPGPGGGSGGMGPGAGAPSQHEGILSRYNDSGGGGGSFGTTGGNGGRAGNTSSAAGSTYVIGNKLLGGASGGTAGSCTNPPGAGGGALLLFARHKITIAAAGAITSGGGGGAGGLDADCAPGSGAGAGGGSGGSIWLQSIDINGDGVIAANGGGGGGGSYNSIGNGGPGADGLPSTTAVAMGGAKANSTEATLGGNGAIENTPPSMITTLSAGNGGGGGGGLGRILFRSPNIDRVKSSPTALAAP